MQIWKDINDFEGLYQISNTGKIKSLNRIVPRTGKGGRITVKEKIKKSHLNDQGYAIIRLNHKEYNKTFGVHRLVAKHFIENPLQLKEVNHIDGNKANNHFSNLEWVTPSQNIQHAYDNGLHVCKTGGNHHSSRKVIDTVNNIEYGSILSACQELGITRRIFARRIKKSDQFIIQN